MYLKRSLLLLLLLSLPAIALATLPAKLVENLQPLEGVIIMPIGAEYLIDLDLSQGVAEGDIFSVVTPGQPIIHPASGEILGSLDSVIGWLQVTRVKNGYSYSLPLGSETDFSKGAQIKRYENLPALFWDYTGDGEMLLAELRSTLPHLDWLAYRAAQQLRPEQPQALDDASPKLFFVHRSGQLELRGAEFQLLGEYATGSSKTAPAVAAVPTTASVPLAVVVAPVAAVSTAQSTTSNSIVPAASAAQTESGIVYNQLQNDDEFWSAQDWSDNPLGIEVNDFDGDGTNEIAILFKDRLEIARITDGNYQQISSLKLHSVEKPLNISSADLDNNGRPELFISAASNQEATSLVIAENDGDYQIVQSNLSWFLHATTTPDGAKMVLAQRIGDTMNPLSPEIVRLSYSDGKYVSAGRYLHRWGADVFSLQLFNDPQGKTLLAAIDHNDRLRVSTQAGEKLWESSQKYGGSVVSFMRQDYSGSPGFDEIPLFIKPRLALMDDGTLLAPYNEGWRFSDSFQSIGPGRVVALQWDGNTFIERWHSKPQKGSLVDFQYADIDNDGQPELAILLHYSRAGLIDKGKAGLRVFELK